jgi:hypothetical protein
MNVDIYNLPDETIRGTNADEVIIDECEYEYNKLSCPQVYNPNKGRKGQKVKPWE